MFLKRKPKKPECEHDWHELRLRTENEYHWPLWEKHDYADVYCPLCSSHRTFSQKNWFLIKKGQEIKKQYKTQ